MNKNRKHNILRSILTLVLMFLVSIGYYEEIIQDAFDNTIEVAESIDGEEEKEVEEKEEKEERKEREIDELISHCIDKYDFISSNKDLIRNDLGKNLTCNYLDKFTPPPELT